MSIWATIDRLVDECTDEADLETHGLGLWAAKRWYASGRPVPTEFLLHERAALMATMSVAPQLSFIRQMLDGPIILMKGPEIASRYPDPGLRPFGDLDILVPDPDEAQQKLLAAGYIEIAGARPHHRPPLQLPGSLLFIEIHERPNYPGWVTIPTRELFASAVPSSLGVEGVMTVSPAHHAMLLAAHSWKHEPFRRLIDLVDVAAMSEGIPAGELDELASRWGLARVWKIISHALDALRTGIPPRGVVDRFLWGHLWELRERRPVELVLANQVAHYWAPMSTSGVKHIATTSIQFPFFFAYKSYRYLRYHQFSRLPEAPPTESPVDK